MIKLCDAIDAHFVSSAEFESIFSREERNDIQPLAGREQPQYGKPGESCKYNLFFGFFFDGTRNNYMACEPTDAQAGAERAKEVKVKKKTPNCHSNVARLDGAHLGQAFPRLAARPDRASLAYRSV